MERASPPDLDDPDAEKRARLAQTRRWATIVLAVLASIWLLTFLVPDPPLAVRLIRHMAEAGMIGGLADWFAVEALFRHPLRIPIPHTALLPRNQARAAESVGQFFNSYFLDPASITARVAEMAPARRAAQWLAEPSHARMVAGPLRRALAVALRPGEAESLPPGVKSELRAAIESDAATKALVRALEPVIETGLSGPLLDDTLGRIKTALDGNRDRVLEIVQDKSRWWVASRVDRGVSTVLVDGVIDVLSDLEDRESAIRKDFDEGVSGLLHTLAEDGALTRAVHEGKGAFVRSDAFSDTMEEITRVIRERLSHGMADEPDAAETMIAEAIEDFAQRLLADPETLARFEAQLTETAQAAIVELRAPVAGYVADVIAGWDAETLSARFENEIGPDLQFIRINGAVLGTLIGGVLFFVGLGLSSL
ncbi:MAG: DUF445 domain-containing protein [Pseudomonadota bacterium]